MSKPSPGGYSRPRRPTLPKEQTITLAEAAAILERSEDRVRLLIAYETLTPCGRASARSETPNMMLLPLQQVLEYRNRLQPWIPRPRKGQPSQ